MKESQVREHITKGWVRALLTFEIVGRPIAHVEKSLTEYMDNIKADSRIIVLNEDREESMEHEDGLFSAFCEVDMLAKNLEVFTWLCINFSPASIEITSPTRLSLEARDVTNWLNDLLAGVHDIGSKLRTANAYTDHMRLAVNQLVKNSIMLSLRSGPKTTKQIEDLTGVINEQLVQFLSAMHDKLDIVKDGDSYSIPDPQRKTEMLNALQTKLSAAKMIGSTPKGSVKPANAIAETKASSKGRSGLKKSKK